jgi:hypothetical protein
VRGREKRCDGALTQILARPCASQGVPCSASVVANRLGSRKLTYRYYERFVGVLCLSEVGIRTSTQSRIDLAVNTSGDPTTPWTPYQIDTTDIGGKTGPNHPGCPCLGDQPTLGIDPSNVYITTNEFSLLRPEFNGAQVYAIAKSELVPAGPSATPAPFRPLRQAQHRRRRGGVDPAGAHHREPARRVFPELAGSRRDLRPANRRMGDDQPGCCSHGRQPTSRAS